VKPDFHLDATVYGMSLIGISPGLSGAGKRPEGSSAEIVKAVVETAIIGVGGVLVTKSWIPLVVPFGYMFLNYLWDNSDIPQTINQATDTESPVWQ